MRVFAENGVKLRNVDLASSPGLDKVAVTNAEKPLELCEFQGPSESLGFPKT